MSFAVEIEKEKDGCWIAEIPQIPGAMAYGRTRAQAVSRVETLHCEFLLSGSSMGKLRRSSSKSFQLQQREPVGLIADRFRSDVQLEEPAQSGWDH